MAVFQTRNSHPSTALWNENHWEDELLYMRLTARHLAVSAGIVLLLLLTGSNVFAAQSPGGLEMQVQAAFDGTFKHGEWLPVQVSLENNGADLEAEVQVRVVGSYGGITYSKTAELPRGSRKEITLYTLPNSYSRELEVRLVGQNEILAVEKIPVQPQTNFTYFIGLIAPQRGALTLLSSLALPEGRPVYLLDLDLDDLPHKTQGLGSFDCLILNDSDTSTLSPEQISALETWIQAGGILVIGGGAGAGRTAAGLSESLLPVHPGNLIEVDELDSLAAFSGNKAIRVEGPFILATGDNGEGQDLITENGIPVLRTNKLGNGMVVFSALDLSAAPFDAWAGTPFFWERLLGGRAVYPNWLPRDLSSRQVLASRMSSTLINLPSLDLPSVRMLTALLVAYILLVGPVNYFLLKRWKRLQQAWITIPVITLIFSGGTFGLGYALRGRDLILNKIGMLEMLPGGSARSTSFLGLFSPSQNAYEIDIRGGGLLSLMDANYYDPWSVGIATGSSEVTVLQGDTTRVSGLSVGQWSMQAMMAEGISEDLGQIVADLTLTSSAMEGTIENLTAFTLLDAVVVAGYQFERLGDLEPGAQIAIDLQLDENIDMRFGPSLSWSLVEDEFNDTFSGANREAEIKRSILEMVLDSDLAPAAGRAPSSGPLLVAWIEGAPPEVEINSGSLVEQAKTLLIAPLNQQIPDKGPFSIPAGLIPGFLIIHPQSGGTCGSTGASIWLDQGEAVFEFIVPAGFQSANFNSLTLYIQSDMGQLQGMPIAVYDWQSGDWVDLENPGIGANQLSDADNMISDTGAVQIRISSADGNPGGGCTYLNVGLEGLN
jgi:hypothetical protein